MTVNNLDFTAKIDAWTKETEQRMTAVFRQSAQKVISIAANGAPIDTGFARASVRASLESMPEIVGGARPQDGQAYQLNFGQVTGVIAGAQIGQTVYAGWTASYVIYLEYGHSKQAPNGFVRVAAEQWPQIVSEVTSEAKSRT